MQPIEKFIFMIGMMHSGTSWVNDWLGKHPLIYTASETRVLVNLTLVRHGLQAQWGGVRPWYHNPPSLLRSIGEPLLAHADCRNGEPYVLVRHSNMPEYTIKELGEEFPEAYFILIHRDARRILASQKSRNDKRNFQKNIEIHQKKMSLIIEGKLPTNTMVLKYTDLVTKSSEMSRQITQFLEIDHHCDIDVNNKINVDLGRDEDCWKSILSREEQKKCEEMNRALEFLGYEI